ncbi:sensor histidine kinase [Spirillospora sp. CA-294931]|uniref:sensor histidine kinase n=1 Tax=Spirillospora sp. CA-294931 TaxID=3240042 RepID=UPI003D92383F
MNDSELHATRLSRRQLIGLDAVASLVYTALFAMITSVRADHALLGLLLVALMGPPLAVRRMWPVPVFALVLTSSLVGIVLDLPWDSFIAAAFALYTVASTQPRRRWIPTRAIGVLSGLVIFSSGFMGPLTWQAREAGLFALGLAVLGAGWTLGRVVRERRAHTERSTRQYAERAVTDERLRIARELHDVVAHSMSLIAVKAGVAVHVAEARPDEALRALGVIESTSRGALTEMRQLLGVLRAEATEDELAPAPGLASLDALVENAAMAGVRVDLVLKVDGLPEGVELSVYRIVQEALTNVVKHAAPAHCRVLIESGRDEVNVQVTDDGPGTRVLPGETGGHGLIGMRERVMMYGGDFAAGPRAQGGFAVSARLPYEETRNET